MNQNLPEAIFSLGIIFISFYFENYWVLLSLFVPLLTWVKIDEEANEERNDLKNKLTKAETEWYKRRK